MYRNAITMAVVAALAFMPVGCGCEDDTPFIFDGINTDTAGDWGSDSPYDVPPDYSSDTPVAGFGTVTGRVMSPQSPVGSFPISGALVYVTKVEPEHIPEGVYCNECVEMPSTIPHTFSGADGAFTITGISEGTWMLVVQKGEFRRVRYIEVTADETLDVPWDFATFPNEHHPESGDSTPSIALGLGSFDDMQDIMAKIGLCDLDGSNHAILDTCNHIDFYDNGGAPFGASYPSFDSLLRDRALMDQYHIIFAPCSSSVGSSVLSDPGVVNNVRGWVEAGGKWYIADWSYDLVEQIFPDFIDFEGDDASVNAANSASSEFDTTGRAVWDEMRQWIELGLGANPDSIEFEENWDCIVGLGTVPGTDPDGAPVSITPDVYCEGPITRSHDGCMDPGGPLTVTFPYGCGKVLFTTYHSVGAMGGVHPDLLLQEQILVYMILEVGLCTDPVDII